MLESALSSVAWMTSVNQLALRMMQVTDSCNKWCSNGNPPRCDVCKIFGHISSSCAPQAPSGCNPVEKALSRSSLVWQRVPDPLHPSPASVGPAVIPLQVEEVAVSTSPSSPAVVGAPSPLLPSSVPEPSSSSEPSSFGPCPSESFTVPRHRRLARRCLPLPFVASAENPLISPSVPISTNRFCALAPSEEVTHHVSSNPLIALTPSANFSTPANVIPHSDILSNFQSPSSPLAGIPSIQPSPIVCAAISKEPSDHPSGICQLPLFQSPQTSALSLRPGTSLSMGSSKRGPVLPRSVNPSGPIPFSDSVSSLCEPFGPVSLRRNSLLNKYSSAKSAASGSLASALVVSQPLSVVDPLPLSPPPSVGVEFDHPSGVGPSHPSAQHGQSPHPPVRVVDGQLSSIPSDPGSDSHSDSEEELAPFVDPIYMEKLDILNSDVDSDRNHVSSLNNRTVFHWEENSPPRLFRKTPHHS